MSTLGNSDAVRAGNAKEAARRPARQSPARETAEKRAAATPEREVPEVDELAEDLRRAVPGISDAAIEDLRKQYRR